MLLSLRNGLLPSSPLEKSTLPFARSEPPPPNARNAAESFASLSWVVVGRAGDGDVCKYSIKFATSSASARGAAEYIVSLWARGGVAALATVEKDDSAEGSSDEGAVVVRAELCAYWERE